MIKRLISFFLVFVFLVALPLSARYRYNPYTRKLDFYEAAADIALGDIGDITLTGLATGDLLYYNGTAWVNLTIGAGATVLTVAAGIPSWQAAGAPGAHAASHEVGGADLVDHDQLTNYLAAQHLTLPNTIVAVLTDHNTAAHDALNIDADTVDGEHAAAIVTNARVKAHFPDTIVNILSDHNLAVHTALGLYDAPGDVDHDLTTNYVANQHIDHTAVSILSAGLITGGGTIDGNQTLTLTEATIEAAIDTLANLTSIQGQNVTFSGSLNVEANSNINQDLTTDAAGVQFADITLDNGLVVNDDGTTGEVGVDFTSINATFSTIAQSDAEGIAVSSDLRIGLDETLRTLIICDITDIADDFGLTAQASPSLIIMGEDGFEANYRSVFDRTGIKSYGANPYAIMIAKRLDFSIYVDNSSGDAFKFFSNPNIELIDTNARQAWMYLEPKVLQTSTAAFDGIYLNVDDANLTYGDGSTGDGNNLLRLAVGGTTGFKIDVDGNNYNYAYNRYDYISWNDCFDHGTVASKYQFDWDISSLNTQGNGSNTVDTTPSEITLTTDNNAIGDNEGTRTEFAIIQRARKNRTEWSFDLKQTANTQFYMGWNTSGTNAMVAAADEYVIVFFDASDNANWQIKVGDGATEDVFTSGIAGAVAHIIHEIWVETDGTVHWAVNGTELDITGTVDNLMTASDHYLIVGQAQSVTGAAVIVVEIDYVENEKTKAH